MTALSQEKYLEYVRSMNRICNSPNYKRDALLLIKTICEENAIPVSEEHTTAMGFVWQVAVAAIGSVDAPRALR